ncbi:hypothetical protein B0H13DRAFT_1066482 [Mycena leptocephala]|nr:hypothetical protein B0H13DRAFT_1066482 [Mycena leptocephala]
MSGTCSCFSFPEKPHESMCTSNYRQVMTRNLSFDTSLPANIYHTQLRLLNVTLYNTDCIGDYLLSRSQPRHAWGVVITLSSNLFIYGAGLDSFFQTHSQACVPTRNCQNSMVLIDQDSASIYIHQLTTAGSTNMISYPNASIARQADNINEHRELLGSPTNCPAGRVRRDAPRSGAIWPALCA